MAVDKNVFKKISSEFRYIHILHKQHIPNFIAQMLRPKFSNYIDYFWQLKGIKKKVYINLTWTLLKGLIV